MGVLVKFTVTFKSPDGVSDSIGSEAERYREYLSEDGLSEEEIEELVDEREHEMQAEAERWFRHAEYVTIELDTEAHTATVIKP